MKKCLRILWKIVLTILIILALLILFILCGGLGPVVTWVAPVAAKCVGAEVAIEKCVILPLGGYVRIEGVRVENPETFKTNNAKVYAETPLAQLGKLELDFAMRSLFDKEYVVDKIELTGVRALYAFDYETTNVDALMAQMNLPKPAEATAEASTETTPAPEAAPAKTAEPVDVRLAYVHIEDNSVTIRKFMNIPIPLPPMTLTDTDSRTLREKLKSSLAPVTKSLSGVGDALGSATDSLGKGIGKTTDVLGDGLNTTTDTLGKGLSTTTETLGEGAKAIGEGAKEALKGVKGLFSK